MTVFDARICGLGEGALWHPRRGQLFWFDILGKRMLTQTPDGPQDWTFAEMVSAAGWLDHDNLLIASETALFRFDLTTGQRHNVAALEANNPATRSNDGRADRQGGFWIGTMGKAAEDEAGAIYRYYKGEMRCLFGSVTIPNGICFAPDGRTAYFTDTATQIINRVALDVEGWPATAPEPLIDLRPTDQNPDGAVVDVAGNIWVALWGAAQIAVFDPQGQLVRTVPLAAPHATCPAFGGAGLDRLFCTSATQGMDSAARAGFPDAGKVFVFDCGATGLAEPQVTL
jgi:sugar lactone lactonase YvrE